MVLVWLVAWGQIKQLHIFKNGIVYLYVGKIKSSPPDLAAIVNNCIVYLCGKLTLAEMSSNFICVALFVALCCGMQVRA
jgi:hypothetical protein